MIRILSILTAVALTTVSCQGKKSSSPAPAPTPAPETKTAEPPGGTLKPETPVVPADETKPDAPVVTQPTQPGSGTSTTPGAGTTTPGAPSQIAKNPANLVGVWASSLLSEGLCTSFYRFFESDKVTIELFCRIPGKAEIGFESHEFKATVHGNALTLTETASSCAQRQAKPTNLRFFVTSTANNPVKFLNLSVRAQDLRLRQITEDAIVPLLSSMKSYMGRTIVPGCFGSGRLATFQAQK